MGSISEDNPSHTKSVKWVSEVRSITHRAYFCNGTGSWVAWTVYKGPNEAFFAAYDECYRLAVTPVRRYIAAV